MTIPNFPGKPNPHKWCKHALPGKGCGIYKDRPQECQDFVCLWLIDGRIPDYWFPKWSKIVISPHFAEKEAYVAFIVDPACPGRWREEPWFSDIKRLARAGLEGTLGQRWTSVVLVGDDRIPIVK